ncbi:uncharacterized protein RJT21DRAFT_4926 [Scheffersomyces amazonensis]|uniref:uncharacterized protein n=1 Tax=Scheffersomyces amazonensis TaxID=1078765 RepID=UPI00315C7CBD
MNHSSTNSSPMDETDNSHSHHQQQHHHHIKKKRVGKACDSCRIKKTKCDGKKPCNRCILDNKICVFTEKKKTREKSHPQGYVELLETRLDILTKSLEKLIEISKPHLKVLSDIIDEEEEEDIVNMKREEDAILNEGFSDNDINIPINKVVSYLINHEGLLNNLPMEWEEGSLIAAKLNSKNLAKSTALFGEHKLSSVVPEHDISQKSQTSNYSRQSARIKEERDSSSTFTFHDDDDDDFMDENDEDDEFDDISSKLTTSPQNSQTSVTEQLNIRDISLGGFSNEHKHDNNDFDNESISSRKNSTKQSKKRSPSPKTQYGNPHLQSQSQSKIHHNQQQGNRQVVESLSRPSLFSHPNNATSSSSLPLLTKHNSMVSIEDTSPLANSPPPLSNSSSSTNNMGNTNSGTAPPSTFALLHRRSSSSSITRPFSPSHQKLRNNGHVHKPQHSTIGSISSTGQKNIVSNNGNEFHLQNFNNAVPSNGSSTTNSLFDFNNNINNNRLSISGSNNYDDLLLSNSNPDGVSNQNAQSSSLFFDDFINQQQIQQQNLQQLTPAPAPMLNHPSTGNVSVNYDDTAFFPFNSYQAIDLIVNDNGQETSGSQF